MNGIPSWSGPITPEQAVREMLDAIATMSPGRYGWGIYEEKDAAAKVAANLEMGSGPCHLVWLADHPKTTIGENPERPEHAVVLCVTGNGPTSEKNAQGIIKILTVLRALAEAATTKGGGVMACKRCNREKEHPMSTETAKTPMQCDCRNWARQFTGKTSDLFNHHPTCEHAKDYDGVKVVAAEAVAGIDEWAADEDGVHPKLWEAYQKLRALAGMKPTATDAAGRMA